MFVELALAFGLLLTSALLLSLGLIRSYVSIHDGKQPSEEAKTLGTLETLKIAFLFLRSIPNYEVLDNIAKIYGKIVVMKLPLRREASVIVADMKIAKEIMSSSDWINRFPQDHYGCDTTFKKPIGLLISNGNDWKEARKLTCKLLHQLDFFKPKHLEKFITDEIAQVEQELKKRMEENGGQELTLCPHQMFEVHTLNIVYQVIMKKRFEHGDPVAEEILRTLNVANRQVNAGTSIVDVFPWLRHIPGLTFMDSWRRASDVCYEYFRTELLEKRRKSGTYRTEPADFADYFLLEIDKNVGTCPQYITDEALLVCMRDLVFAGSDTTNSTMEHAVLQMALQPAIQTKVQLEIGRVLGHSKAPSYVDRTAMPYTHATLLEILRFATPVPMTSRSPIEDNAIKGHHVPQGSLCGINIYGIHRSEKLWDNPLTFRPERFLSADGNGIVNTENMIPFGHGRRVCPGETVAHTTLFIFFVTLLQKFTFELSAEHPPPSMKNVLGLSRCPVPYYVRIRLREAKESCQLPAAELKSHERTSSVILNGLGDSVNIPAEGSNSLF